MKKSELKKILKPIIQECIKETLFEGGLLSGIIAECVEGLSQSNTTLFDEDVNTRQKPQVKKQKTFKNDSYNSSVEKAKQEKRRLLETLKKTGLDESIFEGLEPISHSSKKETNGSSGPLGNFSPEDPGIDISFLDSIL
jgi:hypothetical protein